jgi:hypothetical protein
MRTRILTPATAAAVLLWSGLGVFGQTPPDLKPPKAPGPPDKAAGAGRPALPDLIGGLKKTPGCLGVETARTMSGKNVIFAWFENKRAVMKWYYSEVHQDAMHSGFPEIEYDKPMAQVPADAGPILAIASITPAKESHFKGTTMPISQIAIELYQPLPGGVALGGRFAPPSVKVPNLKDYSQKFAK